MLCAECQELLSEYLDGDLSERQRSAIDGHVRNCARCASLRNDLARIIHASASLPLHTPSTRVWEGIRSEIGGGNVVTGPRAWWNGLSARRFDFSISGRQLVAAAAGVLVLAGTFWALRIAAPNSLPNADWSAMGAGDKAQAIQLALSERREEVMVLKGTVADMVQRLEQRRAGWSTELQATYAKSIAELDARIAEGEKAYDADGTELTRGPLLDAYRDKLNALEEFARVDGAAQSHKK